MAEIKRFVEGGFDANKPFDSYVIQPGIPGCAIVYPAVEGGKLPDHVFLDRTVVSGYEKPPEKAVPSTSV